MYWFAELGRGFDFRRLDRVMACAWVRLAAAGANAAEWEAGNTYTWHSDIAKAPPLGF